MYRITNLPPSLGFSVEGAAALGAVVVVVVVVIDLGFSGSLGLSFKRLPSPLLISANAFETSASSPPSTEAAAEAEAEGNLRSKEGRPLVVVVIEDIVMGFVEAELVVVVVGEAEAPKSRGALKPNALPESLANRSLETGFSSFFGSALSLLWLGRKEVESEGNPTKDGFSAPPVTGFFRSNPPDKEGTVVVGVVAVAVLESAGTSGRAEPKLKFGQADSVLGLTSSTLCLRAPGVSKKKRWISGNAAGEKHSGNLPKILFRPSLPFLKFIKEFEVRTGVAEGLATGDWLISRLKLRLGGVLNLSLSSSLQSLASLASV